MHSNDKDNFTDNPQQQYATRNDEAYDNPSFTHSSADISSIHSQRSTPCLGSAYLGPNYLGSNQFIVLDEDNRNTSVSSVIKNIVPWTKNRIRKGFTKKMLYRKLPILDWLPKYNTSYAAGDFIAGITVGLTLIPQGLAYHSIIGLPPQYGLYSSFIGCFIYIIFGSCKDVPFGPSALNAILAAQAVKGRGPEHAILLSFMAGLIQILMGIFGLGFIINFVSGPVSSGFTSAVALIIITSQVKDILGINPKSGTFVESWYNILQELPNTRLWDTVMGTTCIILLLLMKSIGTKKLGSDEQKPAAFQKLFNNITWIIGTGRNAILVIICALIGYVYCSIGEPPFLVIGEVPQGLPRFQPPSFGYTKEVNGTVVQEYTFMEMLSNLGSGIIIVPLVGLLENIAICKAFANGKPVDATQELIALGFCNIGNSFVQGYPGTGALGRSAVNNASGVRTPLGGLYTGILVIVALLFCTEYFYYIPNAVLGAVIIAATIFMIEVKVVKPMWRSKKSCFIIFIVTFIACLVLHLEIGILVGIGINLLLILYHAARPKIFVEKLSTTGGVEYLLLTPDRCLIFPSADYVRHIVTKYGVRQGIPVVIDCSHIYGADFTAATVIETLTSDFAARDQIIFFFNLKPSVCSVFEGLSPKGFVVFYNGNELDDLLLKYVKGENIKGENV
uniref:Sodium-independent sulfate anion transporter-like n=1 Tax=Diabrotica virgifera virgifera TaxID=50390 RepID=A0A6P7FX47_DIAVI